MEGSLNLTDRNIIFRTCCKILLKRIRKCSLAKTELSMEMNAFPSFHAHTHVHIEPPRNPPAFIVLVWDSRHLGSKLKPGGSYWEDNPTAHKENQKTKKHWNSLPRLNSSCIPCGLGPQVQPWDFLQSCFPHIRILNKANLVTSCSGVFMRRLFSLGDHASCTEWSAMCQLPAPTNIHLRW